MAEHTIEMPDISAGVELRKIIWNDWNGKVRGDHTGVGFIRSAIEAAPIQCGVGGLIWRLEDPGRRPEEFLALLYILDCRILHRGSLRTALPAIFDDVELPLGEKAENLYVIDTATGEPVLAK